MNPQLSAQTQGRWTDILQMLGIDAKYLRNQHGPCPICEGTDRFRYDNKNGSGSFFCSSHGSGDGALLAQQYLNLNFKDTAREVRKLIGETKLEIVKPVDNSKNEEKLKEVHKGLRRLHSSNPAGLYLIKRGLAEPPKINVFYHPGIDYFSEGKKTGTHPAMVSRFLTPEGKLATYHITYLNNDGTIANLEPPKKYMGKVHDLNGGAIRLAEADGDTLGISEGIETGLSAMITQKIPVWAAGDAGKMMKIKIPESVKTVIIFADNDKSFTGQMAAATLANRLSTREGKAVFIVTAQADEHDKINLVWDSGLNMDYLDFCLHDSQKFTELVSNKFGKLASVEIELKAAQ
jgi:putative DNA primase/helicase